MEINCVPLELETEDVEAGASVNSRPIVPLVVETSKLWQPKFLAVMFPLEAELTKVVASKSLSLMLPLVVLMVLSPAEKLLQVMSPLEADK